MAEDRDSSYVRKFLERNNQDAYQTMQKMETHSLRWLRWVVCWVDVQQFEKHGPKTDSARHSEKSENSVCVDL